MFCEKQKIKIIGVRIPVFPVFWEVDSREFKIKTGTPIIPDSWSRKGIFTPDMRVFRCT